jgi:hypothetical protein
MTSPVPGNETAFAFAFDHVVVAVRDLAGAMASFERLGFHVEHGGRHPGFGTANALIQFANGYIELLAVEDADVAREAGVRRRELVEYLEAREGGLVGYAFSCGDLDAVRRRGDGLNPWLDEPPLAMSRTRPDGSTIRWRLLVPGGSTWCRPWPFLIEWASTDASAKPSSPSSHANGASTIAGISVGARSIGDVEAFYRDGLGLALQISPRDDAAAPQAVVEVGGCRIEFTEIPELMSSGPISNTVDGEGITKLQITVGDLEAVRRLLAARGVAATSGRPDQLDVVPSDAAGARLTLFTTRRTTLLS